MADIGKPGRRVTIPAPASVPDTPSEIPVPQPSEPATPVEAPEEVPV